MSLTSRSWRCRRRWRGDWWSWSWSRSWCWSWSWSWSWSRSWCWSWSYGSIWFTLISYFLVTSVTCFHFTGSPSIRCGVPCLFSTPISKSTSFFVGNTRISIFMESRITILESTWSICIRGCIPSFFAISIGNISSISRTTNLCCVHTYSSIVAHLIWEWA